MGDPGRGASEGKGRRDGATKGGFKGVARKEGLEWKGEPRPPHVVAKERRVPVQRLMTKLDLTRFNRPAPLIDETVSPRVVRLPLKQHVGAPAAPTVKPGDTVREGDIVASPADGALGSIIHASIPGRVTAVDEQIVIERQ